MPFLPITAVFVALAAVGLVLLSFPIAMHRKRARTSLGDGGDALLQQRIRAQANFAEYVPLALVVLAFVESGGWPGWVVWSLGGALAAGRLFHAMAILGNTLNLRVIGMIATWGVLLVGAGLILAAGWLQIPAA